MHYGTIKLLTLLAMVVNIEADTHAFALDNDFFGGTDRYYTNGVFYTTLQNVSQDQIPSILNVEAASLKDLGFTISQLIFTPEDLSTSEKIENDIPYAGYLSLSCFLFQANNNSYEQIGLGIGTIGKYSFAEEVQKGFHKVIGSEDPKGWDNQLKNDLTGSVFYKIGYKTDRKTFFDDYEFDWTNNLGIDLGNFYSGALISSVVRMGSKVPHSFATTGNFIGGRESNFLSLSRSPELNWFMALGVDVNYIHNFYIVDNADGYTLGSIDYTSGRLLSFNVYYEHFIGSLELRTTAVNSMRTRTDAVLKYGGVSFQWSWD